MRSIQIHPCLTLPHLFIAYHQPPPFWTLYGHCHARPSGPPVAAPGPKRHERVTGNRRATRPTASRSRYRTRERGQHRTQGRSRPDTWTGGRPNLTGHWGTVGYQPDRKPTETRTGHREQEGDPTDCESRDRSRRNSSEVFKKERKKTDNRLLVF